MSTKTTQIKNKSLFVCCPVCGLQLFRSKMSEVEIRCSRCHCDLAVKVEGGRMLIAENVQITQRAEEPSDQARTSRGAAAGQEFVNELYLARIIRSCAKRKHLSQRILYPEISGLFCAASFLCRDRSIKGGEGLMVQRACFFVSEWMFPFRVPEWKEKRTCILTSSRSGRD